MSRKGTSAADARLEVELLLLEWQIMHIEKSLVYQAGSRCLRVCKQARQNKNQPKQQQKQQQQQQQQQQHEYNSSKRSNTPNESCTMKT
jgi:hypothetical protein